MLKIPQLAWLAQYDGGAVDFVSVSHFAILSSLMVATRPTPVRGIG